MLALILIVAIVIVIWIAIESYTKDIGDVYYFIGTVLGETKKQKERIDTLEEEISFLKEQVNTLEIEIEELKNEKCDKDT